MRGVKSSVRPGGQILTSLDTNVGFNTVRSIDPALGSIIVAAFRRHVRARHAHFVAPLTVFWRR